DGKLWIGTRDAGLFYADAGRVTKITKNLPDRKVNTLLAIGANVWVGTDAGIVRWNGIELTAEGLPLSLSRTSSLAMLMDRQSNLWVGTPTGLLRFNATGVAMEGPGNLPAPVNTLFEDREGNLWIGGPWGIQRLSDAAFKTFGRAE